MTVSRDSAAKVNVHLSRTDEVGFTDLMRGTGFGTGGNSGVDWIEVYGNFVSRSADSRLDKGTLQALDAVVGGPLRGQQLGPPLACVAANLPGQ